MSDAEHDAFQSDSFATPRVRILDRVVTSNILRLAQYAAKLSLKIRPHAKTHKSPHFARLQLQAGACGVTVAKAGEAEVMAASSDDILIAYPALDPHRCRRIAVLAKSKTVRIAVDSSAALQALASAADTCGVCIGILVDMDVGYHRTGVQSPEASLALARLAANTAGARLDGLFVYPGHVRDRADRQQPALQHISGLIAQACDLWRRDGLAMPIVSGGSTPTAYQSHLIGQLTEIRPGTYIFNDMNTVLGGFCSLDDCAARVVCTVVSDAVPGKVVIDAGSKTFSSDSNAAHPNLGFGHIPQYPQARIVRLTEEHGEVDVTSCPVPPRLGQRVAVIPNHICPCINLQDSVDLVRADGAIVEIPIEARGKLA